MEKGMKKYDTNFATPKFDQKRFVVNTRNFSGENDARRASIYLASKGSLV